MKLSSIFSKKHFILFLLLLGFSAQNQAVIPFFNSAALASKKDQGAYAYSVSWSPDGRYLAVGGANESTLGDKAVVVYEWNGSSFIDIDPTSHTNKAEQGGLALSVSWSPDGKYLAVGGYMHAAFGNREVAVYEWNGSSLIDIDPTSHSNKASQGEDAYSVAWSPDGRYLAVGGQPESTLGNKEVVVYEWNGASLIDIDPTSHSNKAVQGGTSLSVSWSPDGNYLAVAGYNESTFDNKDVVVYKWDGSSLIDIDPTSHTNKADQGNIAYDVSWSHDGRYLAVCGYPESTFDNKAVVVYEWNGSSLIDIDPTGHTNKADHGTFFAHSVSWSHDGRYLAVGGYPGPASKEVVVYEWNGFSLIDIDPTGNTNKADQGIAAWSVSWSPFGGYLAVGGYADADGKEVVLYRRYGLIDGIRAERIFNNPYPFPINDFGMAIGKVRFKKGISIAANKSFEATAGTKIFEQLNLNDTGKLFLFGDICLGTDISGGIMYGNDNTIFLEHHAMTFSQSVLTFSSDTIIDGQGHDFVLGYSSQLLIDTDVTLTLRNLTLKNTKNWRTFPALKLTDSSSRITFDNVEFAASDDFYFYNGQLYIHNDFVFTGTQSLIYKSDYPCFIEPKSTLHMEPETTFYYDTISSKNNNNELVIMQDKTSAIYLNGCTFMLSNTGLRLTKGQLFFDNHVIIKNDTTPPPALDRYFIWGNHTKGTSYDLNIFILAEANVDLQGYVYYDNAT